MSVDHEARCVASALWAAYGDALGFPTELASPSLVKERTGMTRVSTTVPWRRLVGGKFGATADLPAGAYSDDTQLRLATARAIQADGLFDVEAFAKVELPVWLSYALGAGRGSKAAASSLSGSSTNWFSNFYKSKSGSYIDGGGNGAAMRIQPHVWAAHDLSRASYLPDVLRNAVCTHGNLRGIGGALIHAVSLASVFSNRSIPGPEEWIDFAQVVDHIPELVRSDGDLAIFWLPAWERENNTALEGGAREVADEWATAAAKAMELIGPSPLDSYRNIVKELGGLTNSERGSGTKTALFALVAAWLFRENPVDEALKAIVNVLDSDTDSIATMAGALLGAFGRSPLPEAPLQDREYIVESAKRLAAISSNRLVSNFTYPDILYWQPPKTAIDAVSLNDGELTLLGLGQLEPLADFFPSRQKDGVWQWFKLPFGQTVLCKRREGLGDLDESLVIKKGKNPDLLSVEPIEDDSRSRVTVRVSETLPKIRETEVSPNFERPTKQSGFRFDAQSIREATIDELTDIAIQSGFDAKIIGEHVLILSDGEDAIEKSIAYVSVISKALRARSKKYRK